MINYADHVPHLPPRIWTFKQASGEIWGMEDRETYWRCEGQENEVGGLGYVVQRWMKRYMLTDSHALCRSRRPEMKWLCGNRLFTCWVFLSILGRTRA